MQRERDPQRSSQPVDLMPSGFDLGPIPALVSPGGETTDSTVLQLLQRLGFIDTDVALERFRSLCQSSFQQQTCLRFLPALLDAFREAATPDGSLLNFQRFVESVPDREALFATLARQPRTVEILVKLFVGSQYLTSILIRSPHLLDRLTEQKRLAEFKSRADFIEQGRVELSEQQSLPEVMDQLRRFQQWELLRLAACDKFGLLDLKTVTLQLSLLADALVQISLDDLSRRLNLSTEDLVVLAFGKLGGEELNYSSDVDLVFVCRENSHRYWSMGQQLVRMLDEGTSLGFLYRVDLRLRPWGNAGALVTTGEAYVEYLNRHGQLWEKQALLKARPIAGNLSLGSQLLQQLEPFIFAVPPQAVKQNIRDLRQKAEHELARRGKTWGDVKSGPGGIRDIEFLTQYLQLIHGERQPGIRSINTLEGLIRLAEHELIFPEEYRRLSSGYLFLRTVEHALQLMHNRQEHQLPGDTRSLGYLAGRLDYPDAETFLKQYERSTCAVREVFENYLVRDQHPGWAPVKRVTPPSLTGDPDHLKAFSTLEQQIHRQLIGELSAEQVVRIQVIHVSGQEQKVTIVGRDGIGALSAICGLLFVGGFDIISGKVLAGLTMEDAGWRSDPASAPRLFINEFLVRKTANGRTDQPEGEVWQEFERELNELLLTSPAEKGAGRLVRRVAAAVERSSSGIPRPGSTTPHLLPVEIELSPGEADDQIAVNIRGEDIPGFLYELTNAIAVSGLSIQKMAIATQGNQVTDTLTVLDRQHRLQHPERIHELRAAIVLIKHFTHLLPDSPNPESALLHFQEFLSNLFRQPNWLEQISPLKDSEVLSALATLLGNSDFLWDDFLRLQHMNLFPVVADVQGLQHAKSLEELRQEAQGLLASQPGPQHKRQALNAFKDREMLRVDMRHILGLQSEFGRFGSELTNVAEVVVGEALSYCEAELQQTHGRPGTSSDGPARLCLCALGKFGGRELGYASDIELMFLYDQEGETSGPESLSNSEYFHRLVQQFQQTIQSRRKGIFEVDLRLRPYGNAGSLAVSIEAFRNYFQPSGPAWPYERQALVKLRPVAGDLELGQQILRMRDEWIYRGEPFDVVAMRGLRERQIRQLVRAGTFNAKLSPGGLVDCEYLVQGLQITYGHLDQAIRVPNTREAMKALEARGILTGTIRTRLRDAYRFWRRVIDALRVVRGDASDLAVPAFESEEFLFLSRRLGYRTRVEQLREDLEDHTRQVLELSASLSQLMQQPHELLLAPRPERPSS